jgi:hypothetical protein
VFPTGAPVDIGFYRGSGWPHFRSSLREELISNE